LVPDHGSENTSAPSPPSRSEVEQQIKGLIDGDVGRDAASAWAMQWVAAHDPGIDDPAVWRALNALAGADAPSTDREWLFVEADFYEWLADIQDADTGFWTA
jgi:hypothetical protein